MLEARGLHKTFGQGTGAVQALRGVDLPVREGEFLCIMGPSGSGKSTLLQLLSGLDRPSAGEVFFEGQELSKLSASQLADIRRRRMGFVFQFFNLLPTFSALENVALPLLLEGVPQRRAIPRAHEMLELVGLAGRGRHRPSQLSGGEMQRVAVARALVHRPPVLFADEPTGNLDSKNGVAVLKLLLDCQAQFRTTLVMVTHDSRVAEYANRVVTLVDGRVDSERQVQNLCQPS